jgi:CheY-like chemotaxis protein
MSAAVEGAVERILVVDDEELNPDMLSRRLRDVSSPVGNSPLCADWKIPHFAPVENSPVWGGLR